MPRETVCEQQTGDARGGPEQHVVVPAAHIVMPCPRPPGPDPLEGGNTGGERGPDQFLEQRPVNAEIPVGVGILVRRRRGAAQESFALRTHVAAVGIDQQRAVGDAILGAEGEDHPFLVMDGNVDACRAGNTSAIGARGVHHRAAREAAAIGEFHPAGP